MTQVYLPAQFWMSNFFGGLGLVALAFFLNAPGYLYILGGLPILHSLYQSIWPIVSIDEHRLVVNRGVLRGILCRGVIRIPTDKVTEILVHDSASAEIVWSEDGRKNTEIFLARPTQLNVLLRGLRDRGVQIQNISSDAKREPSYLVVRVIGFVLLAVILLVLTLLYSYFPVVR